MKTFLHIGLPKTGTSALQEYVFPHISSRIRFNDRQVGRVLLGAVDLQSFGMLEDVSMRWMRSLVQRQQARHPELTHFLSLEHLSWGLGSNTWVERASLLHHLLPEAEIILTLRHQPELARSAWLQAVQMGTLCTAEEYFGLRPDGTLEEVDPHRLQREPLACLPGQMLDFDAMVNAFHASFGAGRVHLLCQESCSLLETGRRIARVVDPEATLEQLPQELPYWNVSLTVEGLRLHQLRLEFLKVFGIEQIANPFWYESRSNAYKFQAWLQTMHGEIPEEVEHHSVWDELHFDSVASGRVAQQMPEWLLDHKLFRAFLQYKVPEVAQEAGLRLTKPALSPALRRALQARAAISNQRLAQRVGPGVLPASYLEEALAQPSLFIGR